MEKRRSLTARQKQIVRERHLHKCGCGCGKALEGRVQFDHVLPLWLGGTNDLDNFAPLLPGCHLGKTAKEAITRGKVRRVAKKHAGVYKKPTRKLQGRNSFDRWLGMDGTVRTKKDKT